MSNRQIFVSCGQLTENEKSLGTRVKDAIDSANGFEAYFAERVQDLESLSANIFEGLNSCVGAVIVLQPRGQVTYDDNVWGIRSSVWINQELAVVAYRQFCEATKIPVCVFKDPKVKLEGLIRYLITNPTEFTNPDDVVHEVRRWLRDPSTQFPSLGSAEVFEEKWAATSVGSRRVLSCAIEEGGDRVKHGVIRDALRRKFGLDNVAANRDLLCACRELPGVNFADYNVGRDGRSFSLNRHWAGRLKRTVSQWDRETREKR